VRGAATTIISGTGTIGSSIITITASNVTIDGFKITNAASKRGISVANQSGITITNNTITAIDGSDATTTSENTFGIAVSSSSAAVANITITNNIISNISNANASGSRSTHGIVAGFSDGNFHITNLLIQGNSISTITAGRGAYGVLLSHARASDGYAGCTQSPQVLNNTISNLNGVWAHGIGLEGCTPDAVVQGNSISNLTATKTTAPDAIAITLEDNAPANTVTIVSNSFTGIVSNSFPGVHLGVVNISATNTAVTAGTNWWGCTAGPTGGGSCAAIYPTTGTNAVTTGTTAPCTNSACILAVSAPIIDLHSSGRAAIFATESLSK